MAAFQRILMATDFSPVSEAAFEMAVQLARESKARLDVVHVYQIPTSVSLAVPTGQCLLRFRERRQNRSGEEARGIRSRANRPAGSMPVRSSGRAPRTGRSSRRQAAKKPDLIVMGTHGRRGAARLFLGSVAARVIAAARCPVLTIRCAGPRRVAARPAFAA